MSRAEIEQAVTTLLEQEWQVGDEVRFSSPSEAPRTGTITSVSAASVEVDIGDRIATVPKEQLENPEPAVPELEPAVSELEPVAPEPGLAPPMLQYPGPSDERAFRNDRLRDVEATLQAIAFQVNELLSEVEDHRNAGNWDLELADITNFYQRARAIDGAAGRLTM